MRHVLDRIYGAAAWMAALFMIGTLAMILLSVSGRLLDFHIRGTDAYAGYCMAAAAFLALAHTLKHGFAHKTPLQVAAFEHKLTNHDLDHLVELTENFAIKPNMCGSYQALYHGLKELNDTVRLQIHKENSILFARMAEL